MNHGILFALGCYGLWGIIPVFWKLLERVPADQLLAHRILWSLPFMLLVLLWKKDWSWVSRLKDSPKLLFIFWMISILISINWYTFIWAVNNDFVVEASLGYFINPLVSIVLGVIFLKERPRPAQWSAILLAFIGVFYLTLLYGRPPWVALTLATSFGLYGLSKKLVIIGPLRGLTLETAILFFPALFYLVYQSSTAASAFGSSTQTGLLLIASGPVTAIPLLFFAAAAKKLSLTSLGLMQYLAPTIQFIIGVYIFKENFSSAQLYGFCFIWLALVIFTLDTIKTARRPIPRPVQL